jgi:hypothetical protein
MFVHSVAVSVAPSLPPASGDDVTVASATLSISTVSVTQRDTPLTAVASVASGFATAGSYTNRLDLGRPVEDDQVALRRVHRVGLDRDAQVVAARPLVDRVHAQRRRRCRVLERHRRLRPARRTMR